MRTHTHETCIERDGEEIEILVDWIVENDGIGPYEFWGQQCYDHGQTYPLVECAVLKSTKEPIELSDEEVDHIEQFELVNKMED